MTSEKQKKIVVTRSIDARGTHCPESLPEIKKTLDEMKSGEIMEILSTDERTKSDIPNWCVNIGCEFLGSMDENGYFKVYLIKK